MLIEPLTPLEVKLLWRGSFAPGKISFDFGRADDMHLRHIAVDALDLNRTANA